MSGDVFDKATTLLTELIRKHCFVSGNNRTAYAATHLFLKANGKELNAVQNPRILIGIREGFYNDAEIENWLKAMPSENSRVSEEEFMRFLREVIEQNREFLEAVGRL